MRAALHVIDDGEPGSFSMRKLAEALGVATMTIYGYVRNKEELFGAACELAFDQLQIPAVRRDSWEDQIRDTATELYEICRQHPNLVTLTLTDVSLKPGRFIRRGRFVSALCDAGFPRDVAHRALAVLLNLILGSTAVSGATLWQPLSSEEGEAAQEVSDDAAFRYGVSLVIDGLRADLARIGALRESTF
ncbi:TetR/AcrR family transcriptional regulator [Mycolicibacterium porcinum]|uniref:TetR/AcrR family transcriptional regulator n=1 Tax=Mycolicibacterium porcinum TaxID=39693 RepID=UPI00164429E8|nr:TetR/AcrR family transcriptional regulator [Mycolicibacterium porcinum]